MRKLHALLRTLMLSASSGSRSAACCALPLLWPADRALPPAAEGALEGGAPKGEPPSCGSGLPPSPRSSELRRLPADPTRLMPVLAAGTGCMLAMAPPGEPGWRLGCASSGAECALLPGAEVGALCSIAGGPGGSRPGSAMMPGAACQGA